MVETTLGNATVADNGLVLGAAVGLSGGALGAIFLARHRDQRQRDSDRLIYRLEFPPDLATEAVVAFTRSLVALRPASKSLLGRDSVVFETWRRAGQIEHWLRLPRRQAALLLAQLAAAAPGLRSVRLEHPTWPAPSCVQELRLSAPLPIRTDLAAVFAASLLHSLAAADVGTTDEIVYQVVAWPVGSPTTLPTTSRPHRPFPLSWLAWAAQILAPPARPSGRLILAHRQKLREPLLGVGLRVGARSASRGRSRQLVGRVVGTVHQLDRPGVTFGRRPVPQRRAAARLRRAATAISSPPLYANARELATLVAWPSGGSPVVPGLGLTGGRIFPPSAALPRSGRVYGRATYPGLERPVAVAEADTRMHTLVIGPTGSGKTTALLGLVTQDLAAGKAVIVVDPNVGLAEDTIARIPQHRTGDLIYLNPAADRAVPLNPLDCAPEDAELVADQMLELIRDRSLSWGVTIEELLRNTLVLLAASPGMTLTEVPAVLRDDVFRTRLLGALDPAFRSTVGEFFAGFAARGLLQQAQDVAAVLNKVSPLVDRRPVRAMLGQDPTTWTMRQVIDEGKILIVALPSGVVSPLAADIIGSTVVRMVWNAVLGRSVLDPTQRRPVSLYLDELARFVGPGTDLADVLARARSFGLDVVGALQHLAQVPSRLQAALLSEARNKLILQPAADDARLLARHLPGVESDDLLALPPRTALASLVAGGRVTPPVTLALPAAPPSSGSGPAARTFAAAYGRDRADVERAIQERRRAADSDTPRRTRWLP